MGRKWALPASRLLPLCPQPSPGQVSWLTLSFPENSHTPLLEGAVTQMTSEEHYRRMMSALNEHSTFEEQQQQQQRLYQLANTMAVPSHSGE